MARRNPANPNGARTQKMERQPNVSRRMPPSAGPDMSPKPATEAIRPNALPRSLGGKALDTRPQRKRDHHRSPRALHRPKDDQRQDVRRDGGAHETDRVDQGSGGENGLVAELVPQPAHRQRQAEHDELIGQRDPDDGRSGRVEHLGEGGKRDRDYREIGGAEERARPGCGEHRPLRAGVHVSGIGCYGLPLGLRGIPEVLMIGESHASLTASRPRHSLPLVTHIRSLLVRVPVPGRIGKAVRVRRGSATVSGVSTPRSQETCPDER